jgi:hypothetical protein
MSQSRQTVCRAGYLDFIEVIERLICEIQGVSKESERLEIHLVVIFECLSPIVY